MNKYEKIGYTVCALIMAFSLFVCSRALAIGNNPSYTFRFVANTGVPGNSELYVDGQNALVGSVALTPGLNDLFGVFCDGSSGCGCPQGAYNMAGYVAVYRVVNGIPTLWSESPVFYSPGYKDVAVGISGNTTTGVVTFSGYVPSDPCGQ